MAAELILREGREKSLLRRHPWVFSGAVAELKGGTVKGGDVVIRDSKGRFLATGALSPDSRLVARVWTFRETEAVDQAFFDQRFRQAMELRRTVFGELPEAYRLINAESDGLPGVIVDLYNGYAVCQFSSAGAEFHRAELAAAVLRYAKGAYERSDVDSRVKEGLEPRTGHLGGEELPETIEFMENGIRYRMNPRTGHKTGFYLDQRMSRRAVMEAAKTARNVLNCFCYTGGFGLAAVKGGAAHVLNVDSSASALELARTNAELNGFSPEQFETQEADVFQFLRKCRDAGRSFDLIILDPPKFAETVSQVQKAARAYKDINLLAMKLLSPGGQLFSFSCSGAMDDALFGKVIDSAACDAKTDFRITGLLEQGPDHPVAAHFPEGRYLKGISGIKLGTL
ncbi:MAG: class I SAM-dependent rRNA methyltransferase [Victivallales bacterium]